MKRLLVTATVVLYAMGAEAASRHDITNMTCDAVQALVKAEGQVVLSYGSSGILGLALYDRFVWSQQFCLSGEVVRGAGVPTLDKKYCAVKKCVQSDIFSAG